MGRRHKKMGRGPYNLRSCVWHPQIPHVGHKKRPNRIKNMEVIEKLVFFSFWPKKFTLTPRSSGTGARIKIPKTLLLGNRGGISIPSQKANPVTSLRKPPWYPEVPKTWNGPKTLSQKVKKKVVLTIFFIKKSYRESQYKKINRPSFFWATPRLGGRGVLKFFNDFENFKRP